MVHGKYCVSEFNGDSGCTQPAFATEKKPTVIIKEAPETLEDEDLLEMVNVGLIPLIVVDKPKADFWKQIFPKIKVHDGVAVRTGGNIAWVIRKGSPQVKVAVDDLAARHAKGSTAGNMLMLAFKLQSSPSRIKFGPTFRRWRLQIRV